MNDETSVMYSTKEGKYTIALFLKFGTETNIRDLYENGTIWMSSLQYIRDCDEKLRHGDKYEGISAVRNYPPGPFEIPEIHYKGHYHKIHLREVHESVLGNIYCLYAVSSFGFPNPDDFYIDERMLEFGSHVLLIKNCKEFLKRLKQRLVLFPFKNWLRFVRYYDVNSYHGELTVFQKRNDLEYQKEFRIYIERPEISPFSFNIGGLQDISEMHASTSIIKGLKLIRNRNSVKS